MEMCKHRDFFVFIPVLTAQGEELPKLKLHRFIEKGLCQQGAHQEESAEYV